MAKPGATKLDLLQRLLAGVDKTYSALPPHIQLEVERVTQGLAEIGPRMLRRAGPGMEFFDQRDFNPETDEKRDINDRLSARAGLDLYTGEPRRIVIVKEAEIRQHVYLWRDATPSMEFTSGTMTKKQAAEIMLLAMARHLARNEDMVGVLDAKGAYRGSGAQASIAKTLFNVSVIASDMPEVRRKLPRNSTGILFSDCMMAPQDFADKIGPLVRQGLDLHVVLVLDPQEIDFNYDGHFEFQGLEGDGTLAFSIAQDERAAYHKRMNEHLHAIQTICAERRIKLVLQRTDQPLENALLSIYGVRPRNLDFTPKMGVK